MKALEYLWTVTLSLLLALAVLLLLKSSSPAHAEYRAENWKGYSITPQQKEEIRRARPPIPGATECCGTADGIPVEWDIRKDHYWANWDGAWRQIPDDKVIKHLEGVAFPIIWVTNGNKMVHDPESGVFIDQGYRDVRCFWPGAGG